MKPSGETPVVQFDMNGNKLREYKSISEASRLSGIGKAAISDTCNNERHHTNNFKWKYKTGQIKKGTKSRANQNRKINQYDLNLNYIKSFSNIEKASKSLKISRKDIYRVCRDGRNPHHGFIFTFDNERPQKRDFTFIKVRKVGQYDLQNKLINKWDTIGQASKTLQISNSHISEVCNNKRKTAGGFIWKFLE